MHVSALPTMNMAAVQTTSLKRITPNHTVSFPIACPTKRVQRFEAGKMLLSYLACKVTGRLTLRTKAYIHQPLPNTA